MYNRDGAPATLPIYVQVSEQLIRDIAAGRYLDGERLPTEQKLAASHGVTVRTLRKSLKLLQDRGLLHRVQGSGNYVRAVATGQGIYSMFRIELLAGGGLPTARFLDVEPQEKPDDLPAFGTSPQATRMRRIRFLNDLPVAIEEIWLDGDCGTVDAAQASDSLYHYYNTKLGFWVSRAEDQISMQPVPNWAPNAFGPAVGTHTVFIERLSWAQKAEPIEFSRTWMDANVARYVQRLK